MGRGAHIEEPLAGPELLGHTYLERAAIENWSRFSDGPTELNSARVELFELIRSQGELSEDHPSWMTQPKPGVEYWLHLPDEISLELEHDPGAERYRFRALNAVAPKRVRKGARPAKALAIGGRDDDLLSALEGLASPAEEVHLSLHCYQRAEERASVSEEVLRDLLADAELYKDPPAWADAASHGAPTLIIDLEDDQLALPLVLNRHRESYGEGRPFVATTCISRSWSQAGLWDLEADELAEKVKVTSQAAKALARLRGIELADPDQLKLEITEAISTSGGVVQAADGSPAISTSIGEVLLKPASADQRRRTPSLWHAVSVRVGESAD